MILGRNALLIYVGSLLLEKILAKLPFTFHGEKTTLQHLALSMLLPLLPQSLPRAPEVASLLYAVCITAFWLVIAWLLHRRRLYWRACPAAAARSPASASSIEITGSGARSAAMWAS